MSQNESLTPKLISGKVIPLGLAALLLVADFFTKLWVMAEIPLGTLHSTWLGGFLNIIHVRNTGAAFSFGHDFPDFIRVITMILIPLGVLVAVLVYFLIDKKMSLSTRYAIALILSGGLGNQIDRIFYGEGVVDFIQVKIYGFLGMEFFPTFNVADSCITIGGALLILTFLFEGRKKKPVPQDKKAGQ